MRVSRAFDGNAIALWIAYDGTWTDLHSSRYDSVQQKWTKDSLMESSEGGVKKIGLSINHKGNATAVWVQKDSDLNEDLVYSKLFR